MSPTEVLKAQELVYELRIGDIMSRRLVTVTADTTMREVKTILRDRRISGLPVLDGGNLAGRGAVGHHRRERQPQQPREPGFGDGGAAGGRIHLA